MKSKGYVNKIFKVLSETIKNPTTELNYSDEFNSWTRSHGGNKNLKFSGSKYLNTTNAKNLKLIWKYKSKNYEESKWKQNVETNPVFFCI